MEVPPGKVLLPSREAAGASGESQFRQGPALRIEVIHRRQVGPWTIQEQRLAGQNVPSRPAEQHMVEILRVVDGHIAVAAILPA